MGCASSSDAVAAASPSSSPALPGLSQSQRRPSASAVPTSTYRASPFPLASRCPAGGVIVAHLGVRGLDQVGDVERVVDDVVGLIQGDVKKHDDSTGATQPVLLDAGDVSAKEKDVPVVVAWTALDGGLFGFVEDAECAGRLLRIFHRVRLAAEATVSSSWSGGRRKCCCCEQFLFLDAKYASSLPNRDAVLTLLARVAGVEVRICTEFHAFLAEVPCLSQQPEGGAGDDHRVVSRISGPKPTFERVIGSEDGDASQIVEGEKAPRQTESSIPSTDLAAEAARLIGDQTYISNGTTFSPGAPAPRDGHLRRLALAVRSAEEKGNAGEEDKAWTELFEAVLDRDIRDGGRPLLLLTGPDRELRPMTFADVGTVIPVFFDLASLNKTARDTGVRRRSTEEKTEGKCDGGGYGVAEFTVGKLAAFLEEKRVPPVFNTFREAEFPIYLRPGMGSLRALGEGKVPSPKVRRQNSGYERRETGKASNAG